MKIIPSIPKRKKIGILGGMGPVSTAHFFSDILSMCQNDYGAVEEGDYPAVVMYSLPMAESTTKGFEDFDATLPQMIPVVKIIEKAGADFIVIPCNTAHLFYEQMQAELKIPIVSMITEVVSEAKKRGYKSLGIMGTHTTVKSGLYRTPAEKAGIKVVDMTDSELEEVATVIGNVTSGKQTIADTDTLRRVAEALAKRGADAVILGCTELPLALKQKDTKVSVMDSMGILTVAAVQHSYGN